MKSGDTIQVTSYESKERGRFFVVESVEGGIVRCYETNAPHIIYEFQQGQVERIGKAALVVPSRYKYPPASPSTTDGEEEKR